jgi:hypothetical protein
MLCSSCGAKNRSIAQEAAPRAAKLRGVPLFLSRPLIAALALFALALVPRVMGLTWGLPSREHWFSFHPDERQIAEAVLSLNPLGGDFNPNFFNYPSLFISLSWLSHFVLSGFGFVTPADGTSPWPWPLIRDITFASRLLCALLGAATAPLVFHWARRITTPKVALLAGVLCALSPGLVQHSHFATVDVPATFFVVLCLFWTTLAHGEDEERARRKYLLLAALAAGLAAATKYNGVLAVVAPLFVAATLPARGKYLPMVAAACVAGFLIGCPFSVLSFSEFWGSTDPLKQSGFAYELITHPRQGSGEIFERTGLGWIYHAVSTLPFAIGWPVLLLAAAFAIHEARTRRSKYLWPALAFATIYFLSIGASQVRFMRYVFPIAPVLILLATQGASTWAPRWKHPRSAPVLAGLLVLFSAWGTRDVVYPFVAEDARDGAAKYLRAQVGPGSSPQTVGLGEKLWFYAPPILPQNAPVRGFELPADSPGGRLRAVALYMGDVGAARLRELAPQWVSVSDFEDAEGRRLQTRKYLDWARALEESYELAWSGQAQAPLALPGRDYVPHDFLYPNPRLRIYRRR